MEGLNEFCASQHACKTQFTDSHAENAVKALLTSLDQARIPAKLQCSPETTNCSWRMDAALDLQGMKMVLDHTRITWAAEIEPWIGEMESRLLPRLAEVLGPGGLRAAYSVPRITGGKGPQRFKKYDLLQEHFEANLKLVRADSDLIFRWFQDPFGGSYQFLPRAAESLFAGDIRCTFVYSMGPQPDLVKGFEDQVMPVIREKMTAQLHPTEGEFQLSGLILDQSPGLEPKDSRKINFLVTPLTIQTAFMQARKRGDPLPDRVWLYDSNRNIVEIWPLAESDDLGLKSFKEPEIS